ncbi:Panacea domain-containing protein [Psittacicella hinzii]|uniref:Antitoxin SocA-like Panacea domain-containing protein n=1 Tax=Psittacicella hinzii TaxID=2028575 RepID=A0A3A1YRA3_9GAMM|nr:type II toxin-antitoxin system antitoxin SocA domain-containing protein [Psittacicella hinzii]RIY39470.1 hypothetical protein CKF58_02075 [Psittacicella hinzii]
MTKKYFFENVEDLIAYLYTKVDTIPPLKLQKALYFLYAYYSAMFTAHEENKDISEVTYNLPAELFPAKFQAWYYGPVINSVYLLRKYNEDHFKQLADKFSVYKHFSSPDQKQVRGFIDKLFNTVLKSSDFGLVDRSHEDKAWKNAFAKGRAREMDSQEIIKEYAVKFAK